MQLSEEDVSKSIDLLIETSNQLEQRLIEVGFEFKHAHGWMFNLCDILYDWRYSQLMLAKALNASDMETVPELLESWAASIHYSFKDEIDLHMTELERL